MSNEDYYEIVKQEKSLRNLVFYGSGGILFAILLLIVLTYNDLDAVFYFIFAGTLGTTFASSIIFNKYLFLRPNSTETLFDKIGHERLVLRYNNLLLAKREYLKLFIGFMIIFGLILYARSSITDPSTINVQVDTVIFGLITIPGMILYALQITIARFNRNSDFYFFQCVGCFETIANHTNISMEEKSRIIYYGLNSYNNYLRAELKRHITNLNVFYLKILADSDDSMNKIVMSINNSLQSTDKLSLLRNLTFLYGDPKSDFLIADIVSRKILEIIGIILGPVITILIFVISIMIEKPFVG